MANNNAKADSGPQPVGPDVDKIVAEALKKALPVAVERALLDRDQAAQNRSLQEQAVIRAEIEKGYVVRSQEFVDREFPEGRERWRIVLNDKNGHPELVIPANSKEEAVARYNIACGIIGFSDPENQQKYAIAKEPGKASKKELAAA